MKAVHSASHLDKVRSVVEGRADQLPRPLDSRVARSWQRCVRDYHLDPASRVESAVLTENHLRERREALGDVLRIATEESRNIYAQTRGSGCAIIVTDANGVVLSWIGDDAVADDFRRSGLWEGAIWDEAHEGTNGVGTCLAENRHITIHRDEHFLCCHQAMTCTATPIRNAMGEIVAILDASTVGCEDSKASRIYTAALLHNSAKRIEHWYFLRAHIDYTVVSFNRRPELTGTLDDCLLALDDDGRILAADDAAVAELQAKNRHMLAGTPLEEVLDFGAHPLATFVNHAPYSICEARAVRDGVPYYALIRIARRRDVPLSADRPQPRAARSGSWSLTDLAGTDPAMMQLVDTVSRVVDKPVSILLCGETGTGKETLARALYAESERAGKPFVTIKCGAIPDERIDSELFGSQGLTATAAAQPDAVGKIAAARDGTLFLDEIGDMSATLQMRLLQVFERSGTGAGDGAAAIVSGLHVICTTNSDIHARIGQQAFRRDLYYHLAGLCLQLPPLRSREDLASLIRAVLNAENQTGRPVVIDSEAMTALLRHRWPGNVRELQNVLRAALAIAPSDRIRRKDLALVASPMAPEASVSHFDDAVGPKHTPEPGNPLMYAEREAILKTLECMHWNVTRTSAALGISRKTLYRRFERHGIVPKSFR